MLFRHGTDTGKRATRSGGASEAQLKELRSKARRRLIGALALVLAAFIVVPWLFDEPAPDETHAPVVVPATPAGLPPVSTPAPADAVAPTAPASAGTPAEGAVAQGGEPPKAPLDATAGTSSAAGNGQLATVTPLAAPESPPAAKPAVPQTTPSAAGKTPVETEKPVKPSTRPAERTDDGSVALALLSGKSPVAARGSAAPAAASGQGRYYLQVAAYTTEQDAQSRRDSLRQSGVTDAYVERGQSGGRTVYRLRVGPFGSHEAAQAAQARLRALGYQNGLISDK